MQGFAIACRSVARPRESDVRKFPEQAERFRRAMMWAGVSSAAELSERLGGALTQPTLNNRIQGNYELRPIEVEPIAQALGVHPAVLRPDGPELPDPDADAHFHAIVTGSPGSWIVTVVRPGEVPQEVRYEQAEAPNPFPTTPATAAQSADDAAAGDRLPLPRSKSEAEEESA